MQYKYTKQIHIPVRTSGDILDAKSFSKNEFALASEKSSSPLMTIMFTDVCTDIWTFLLSKFQLKRKVLHSPNLLSANFLIEYFCEDFSITLERKFTKGLYYFFPGVAENPLSYQVIIIIYANDKSIFENLDNIITTKYKDRIEKI